MRRSLFALSVLAGLSGFLAAGCSLPAGMKPATDWPMFQRDAGRTGSAVGVPGATAGELRWRYKTGRSIAHSSPAVQGGLVYIGSQDKHLHAVDAATGELKWKYATGEQIYSSPAVSAGTVYVGSLDKHLHALDAATGELKWKFTTGAFVKSSPAVSGGLVYIGSNDKHLYALDAATGEIVWKFKAGGILPDSPAVSAYTVYIGSVDRHLYALDAATGALRWKFVTGGQPGSPAISGGQVYVGSKDGHVYAVAAATGELAWKYRTGGEITGSPAISAGVLYAGSGDKHLHALDAATGKPVWKHETGSDITSSPAVSGGVVYVGSKDKNLYALDAATGELVWKFLTHHVVGSSPAVAGGMVYVASGDGHLYALALTSASGEGLTMAAPVKEGYPRSVGIGGLVTAVKPAGGAGSARPLPGTRVIVMDAAKNFSKKAETNAQGRYNVELPPGKYKVVAVRKDYLPYSAAIEVQSGAEVWNIHLKPKEGSAAPVTTKAPPAAVQRPPQQKIMSAKSTPGAAPPEAGILLSATYEWGEGTEDAEYLHAADAAGSKFLIAFLRPIPIQNPAMKGRVEVLSGKLYRNVVDKHSRKPVPVDLYVPTRIRLNGKEIKGFASPRLPRDYQQASSPPEKAPAKPTPGPPLPEFTGEFSNLEVVRVSAAHPAEESPEKGSGSQRASLVFTLVGEIPGEIAKAQGGFGEVLRAAGSNGEDLGLPQGFSQWIDCRLSNDKKITFTVPMKFPGPEVTGIAELSGFVKCTVNGPPEQVDLGFDELVVGAKGQKRGSRITTIEENSKGKTTQINLEFEAGYHEVEEVVLLDASGKKVRRGTRGQKRKLSDTLIAASITLPGAVPQQGSVAVVLKTSGQDHVLPFKLTDLDLTGRPLAAKKP